MELNNKHIVFINEWMLNGYNATQAYLTAYPTSSKLNAERNAHRILEREDVKQEIEKRQKENRDKYNVTIDEVVCRVKELMLTDDYNPVHTTNLKAAEILNKMFGFNFENKETQSDDSTEITFKIIKSNNAGTGE
jgi:phage terminase small subunit